MTTTTHNAIRKAAILVAGLDTTAADALLGEMPADVAARVRNAVLELDTIDPAEQRRVLEEFRRANGGGTSADDGGVELESSLAERLEAGAVGASTYQLPLEREQPPFHFLHDTDAAALAYHLAGEQPQTIAVVLAHLRPAHAADVLAQLTSPLQTAVLGRLADLDQAAPEVLREIEQQLQLVFNAQAKASERRANGRSTIAAILNAAAPHVRRQLAARLENGAQGKSTSTTKATNEDTAGTSVRASNPSDLAGAIERLNRAAARPAKTTTAAAPRMAVAFGDLASLDDRALALVLQKAGPRLTLLALAGASGELVNRLWSTLPNREAQMLRQRLQAIGPVRVQDMEAAQAELAQIAGELAAAGRITLTAPRRLSLAA